MQRNCLYYALTAKPIPQYLPKYAIHRKLHDRLVPVINHSVFKAVIFLALVANCILLACQVSITAVCMCIFIIIIIIIACIFAQVDSDYTRYRTIFYINIAFTVFFVTEALFKIIAFTPPVSINYTRSIQSISTFWVTVLLQCSIFL